MGKKRLSGWPAVRGAGVLTVAILALGGCGGSGDDSSGSGSAASKGPQEDKGKTPEGSAPPEDAVLAESEGDGVVMTVTSAVRDSGGFLTVSGKVTNSSGNLWTGGEWRGDESELQGNGGSVAGASLIDKVGKKKYLVLRDTSGRCLCTKFSGGIDSGKSADWFAQFPAPPADAREVDFQVGTMPPATIQISEG
ncbi:hypothetical protein [Streptomyces albidoflavus]|uniref:hypothetical protein n=1 Tax=Streptomyces albidoflavus TaxID=1886 RepID=UPI0038690A3A|nr:hypothetical protein OG525_21175 [Streptomyces albidoflavus]